MIRPSPVLLVLCLLGGASVLDPPPSVAADVRVDAGAVPTAALPPLESEALDGQLRRIPVDLGAGRTIVVLSFRREDFDATLLWMAALGSVPRVQMPVFPRSIRWLRPLIEGGIRDRVPPADHGRVWPIWGAPEAVRAALRLGDDEAIAVVVVDRGGSARQVVRGEPTPAAVDAILKAVAAP